MDWRDWVAGLLVLGVVGCERPVGDHAGTIVAVENAGAPVEGAEGAVDKGVLVTHRGSINLGTEKYTTTNASQHSEISFNAKSIVVELPWVDGPARVTVDGAEREIPVDERSIVLENGHWQAYAVAAKRFAGAITPVDVTVIVPSADSEVAAKLSVVPVADDMREVTVNIEGLLVHAYVNPAGVVTKAEVPQQGLVVLPEGESPSDVQVALPAGATEEAPTVERTDAKLTGALWLPADVDKPDLFIVVAGSGPTDMDGNNVLGVQSNTYALLAEGIVGRGAACLRYDKRGIGKSTTTVAESDVTMQSFAGDVGAWVSWAEADGRFGSIVLVGHSEGGLISLMVATAGKTAAADAELTKAAAALDGLVLVATPGRPLGDVLVEQFERNGDATLTEAVKRIVSSIASGEEPKDVPPVLQPLFRPSIRPFLKSQLALDPAALVADVDVAVAIVQGTTDVQVRKKDAEALADAQPNATLTVISRMNHVLKDEEAATLPQASYTDPSHPLSDGLVDAILAVRR